MSVRMGAVQIYNMGAMAKAFKEYQSACASNDVERKAKAKIALGNFLVELWESGEILITFNTSLHKDREE